jgi:effector-binding domain-containing protein
MRTYEVTLADLQAQPTAAVRGHVAADGIADFLGGVFGEVMGVLSRQGLGPAGPPYGRYVPTGGGFDVEAGFPVHGEVRPDGRVEALSLPGGRVARTLHVGSYETVAEAYDALTAWLTDNGLEPVGLPWESYLDGPEVAEPRTEVYVPCRVVRPGHD